MRMTFTTTFDDGSQKSFNATVSYNKHVVESYRTNDDWNPQLGDQTVHTLCGLSLSTFQSAFDKYGDYLCEKFRTVVDVETFDPQTTGVYDTALGVHFTTDTNRFINKPLHCFPKVPVGSAGGPKTWSLTSAEAAAFIRLARLLWAWGSGYSQEKVDDQRTIEDRERIRDTEQPTAGCYWLLTIGY